MSEPATDGQVATFERYCEDGNSPAVWIPKSMGRAILASLRAERARAEAAEREREALREQLTEECATAIDLLEKGRIERAELRAALRELLRLPRNEDTRQAARRLLEA